MGAASSDGGEHQELNGADIPLIRLTFNRGELVK